MSSKNVKIFDETGCLSEEAMTEYAHGTLDIHLRKQVEIHINECDFCRDALEGISLMKSKEASRFAVARLNAKISGKEVKSGGKVIRMNFLRIAAAVTLFFVLGGGILYVTLNPPFKNNVAETKVQEQKMLAENKVETPIEMEAPKTDSVAIGFLAPVSPDAALENDLRKDEDKDLKKEPAQKMIEILPGNGTIVTEDNAALPANYSAMTATGGSSNVAPSYYNPGVVKGTYSDSIVTFDKYASDDAAGFKEEEKNLSMIEVQTASKNKNADKNADKNAKEITTSKSAAAQQAPAVADYDAMKVAEAKEGVAEGRRKMEDEAAAADKVYAFVDQMPQYPGGAEALKKEIAQKINYPASAREQGISGTVYISYVVNAAGKVTKVKVWKSVNKELDNEAMRVISSLKDFTPGTQEGKAVPVQMSVPVHFNLQ